MGLDQQPRRAARRRQQAERAGRAEGQIADPADIDHRALRRRPGRRCRRAWRSSRRAPRAWRQARVVRRDGRGRSPPPARRRRRRWSIAQPGSSRRTISWTCAFSAWPAPTTDFLTRLAEYSATGRPRSAGASRTTPRATPSFRVEAGFLLTKVSSTAASSGRKRSRTSLDLAEQRHQPLGQRQVDRRVHDPVGDMGQPVAGDVDDPPAGMAQPGIEPDHAHPSRAPRWRPPDQALSRARRLRPPRIGVDFCTSSLSSRVSST